MDVKDFDYELPLELIAQTPLEKRSDSKLLVLDRKTGEIEHKHFYDIIDYLTPNDVLVLNNTKVMPSRIYGTKVDTNVKIEFLLLKEIKKDCYECLVKPARRVHIGTIIDFNDVMKAEIIEKQEEGMVVAKFLYEGIFIEKLEQIGETPLPPYIHEKLKDGSRYQTVYADKLGSAAAPTAGLHFTDELLKRIKEKGVEIEYVTLHVGLGTFRPMTSEHIEEHHMHSEWFKMEKGCAERLNEAKNEGKRIIAVGTTSTRTLEAIMTKYGKFVATAEETNIFIYPGYKFKAIDALITNFHLPKSTLVMLVSAFSTKQIIMNAYKEAIEKKYRFFSFGDAMFIH
ncbi:MAG: tRNA preQ1(34) S-adenosylmethionine ribosyltransferase-isomerase QueA [Acholeplasmataceae bacterium]|nr:tRNA preQ1(34) S-adenosylmethionine ribosyltransferase-isomerase QueA [Acholeplasmataceae bacterium]